MMNRLRMFIAGVMTIFAIGIVLLGIPLDALFISSIHRTIEKNREIDASFRQAADYVESFRNEHGQLPETIVPWKVKQPETPQTYWVTAMEYQKSHFPAEAIANFPTPPSPADAYLLSFWSGERYEYFASWAGKSTLQLDAGAFCLLGSPYLDFAAVLLVSLLLILGAMKLWPSQQVD